MSIVPLANIDIEEDRKCCICYNKNVNLYKCNQCVCLLCGNCFKKLNDLKNDCPNCRGKLTYFDPENIPILSNTWLNNYSCGLIKIKRKDDIYVPELIKKIITLNDLKEYKIYNQIYNLHNNDCPYKDLKYFYLEDKSNIEITKSIDKPTVISYYLLFKSDWSQTTYNTELEPDCMIERLKTIYLSIILNIKHNLMPGVTCYGMTKTIRYICLKCKNINKEKSFKLPRSFRAHQKKHYK